MEEVRFYEDVAGSRHGGAARGGQLAAGGGRLRWLCRGGRGFRGIGRGLVSWSGWSARGGRRVRGESRRGPFELRIWGLTWILRRSRRRICGWCRG